MSIKYINLNLAIHGLDIKTEGEMNELIDKIEAVIRQAHPGLRFASDVEIDRDDYEIAGQFND